MAHGVLLASLFLFLATGNAGSPELLRPPDNASIALGAPRQSIVFSWQATGESPTYRFRIAATEDFKRPILDRTTEKTAEEVAGHKAGKWFWKVTVLDAAGQDVSSSETRSFVIQEIQ